MIYIKKHLLWFENWDLKKKQLLEEKEDIRKEDFLKEKALRNLLKR